MRSKRSTYYLTQNGTNESLGLDAACVLVDDLEIGDERFYQKVRKQVKELKEKGQQVILLTNRPFTESLADKVYYLSINETSLHLVQTIDQVKEIVKLSRQTRIRTIYPNPFLFLIFWSQYRQWYQLRVPWFGG